MSHFKAVWSDRKSVVKAKVSKRGIVIPKEMLAGFEEVEIRREDHQIVIVPLLKDDPILNLGKRPIECGLEDLSVNHDKYLYGA